MSEDPVESFLNDASKQRKKMDGVVIAALIAAIAAVIGVLFTYYQFTSSQEKAEKDKRFENFNGYLDKLKNPSSSDVSPEISGIEEIVKKDSSYKRRATIALVSLVKSHAKRDLEGNTKSTKTKSTVRFPEQKEFDSQNKLIKTVNKNIQDAVRLIADINTEMPTSVDVDVKMSKNKVIDLDYTRLQKIDLGGKNTSKISFKNSYLVNADFEGGILNGAILEKAILIGTNFKESNCRNARLLKADLLTANLSNADLAGADVEGASFKSANLRGTILKGVKNLTNTQIKTACYWEEAIYDDPGKVNKLKREKFSDPKEKRDCKRWWENKS
jgi:uncharacterized protein YjbI with pentapeptide repeats